MAFELYNRSRRFTVTQWEWPSVLALAGRFGWEGEGPLPHPKGSLVDPGYDTSQFQSVSRTDAKLLAEALHRALTHASDAQLAEIDAGAPEPREFNGERFVVQRRSSEGPSSMRNWLTDLVEFCREGGFVIG